MGVAAPLLAVMVLLLTALAAGRAERYVLRRQTEPGPAGPVQLTARLEPARRDAWMYHAGPLVALAAVCLGAVVIPLGPLWIVSDLEIGVFYFIVVVDLAALGIALGGWGANCRGGIEACYRAVAQLIAYVVPLGLAILGPLMMARSLSTIDIVEAQAGAGLWYAVCQPLGLGLYLVTALMQAYRAPFLEPFARDIELGVLGVFGGAAALLWRLALAALLLLVSAMGAVLFLAGYSGPWLPGPVWMALKTAALALLLVAGGRRLRLRSSAELLTLSWRYLIPLGLANVLVVGVLILLGVGQAPFTSSPTGAPPHLGLEQP